MIEMAEKGETGKAAIDGIVDVTSELATETEEATGQIKGIPDELVNQIEGTKTVNTLLDHAMNEVETIKSVL